MRTTTPATTTTTPATVTAADATTPAATTRTASRALPLAGAALTALTALAGLLVAGAPSAAAGPTSGACGPGELCLWAQAQFKGARHRYELADVPIESCVALPGSTTAKSLANRLGRPVTLYQSQECAETAEFETYPGDGTWVPQAPYQSRAFKIWER
ncbi:peptidase inhibitor family I36 protein [Streptomyces sp. NPDC050560]|uniref:peptidase inhibitor family I36 protein n=1 Tax=Streptomyces sp. NPDC050560 TaxID=3365630 RepID=UPI0037A18169